MRTVYFIVDSILTFAVYAFLLRVLLPLVRADFRNPLTQAVLALTNWLVMPLRRLLPPFRRIDTASVAALLSVQIGTTLILTRLANPRVPLSFLPLLIESFRLLALAVTLLYIVLIVVYSLLSFIAPGVRSPATALLTSLCEPVLRPIRQILPIVGGVDFSPLVVVIGLFALRISMS